MRPAGDERTVRADIGITGAMQSFVAQGMGRALIASLAVAGVVLAAGCGVRSTPARPGGYDYPAAYPTEFDDAIIRADPDVPTMGSAPVYRPRSRGGETAPPSAYGDTPPPATETIVR